VLSVFRISKAVENGVEIEPRVDFEPGVVSHPKPFKCVVKPRSEMHAEVIRRGEEVYPWGESGREVLERVGRDMGVRVGEKGGF